MELSSENIQLISRLIAEKLGPNIDAADLKSLVVSAIRNLSEIPEPNEDKSRDTTKNLIVNAFGRVQNGLENRLVTYMSGKPLKLTDFSETMIGPFKSVIAIIDYSAYSADFNELKFELSEICSKFGYKAIVQDSSYYLI